MKEKGLFLLVGAFLIIAYGCACRQVVKSPNIIDVTPQAKELKKEVVTQEVEELIITKEEKLEIKEEMLEEEKISEAVVSEEEKRVLIPPVVEEKKAEEEKAKEKEKAEEVTIAEVVKPPVKPSVGIEEEIAERVKDILRPGERLTFRITYSGMKVGTGVLEIKGVTPIKDQESLHLISMTKSTGIFAFIYRVNERLDSFMDCLGRHSLRFEYHSYGKEIHSSVTTYDQKNHLAYYKGKKIPILPNTHDPISALYSLRLLPLKEGEEVAININTGEENKRVGVRVIGKEKVRTVAGEFNCLVIKPYFKDGSDSEKRTLKIYLTNDARKIPVCITSKLPFGQVVLSLERASGC
ncbi:TPA: hypothetical protein DCX15_04815 [bacterium]|nr:hypothetical protein [bacterium]